MITSGLNAGSRPLRDGLRFCDREPHRPRPSARNPRRLLFPSRLWTNVLLPSVKDVLDLDGPLEDPSERRGIPVTPREDIAVRLIAPESIDRPPRLEECRTRVLEMIQGDIGGSLPRQRDTRRPNPINVTGEEIFGVRRRGTGHAVRYDGQTAIGNCLQPEGLERIVDEVWIGEAHFPAG